MSNKRKGKERKEKERKKSIKIKRLKNGKITISLFEISDETNHIEDVDFDRHLFNFVIVIFEKLTKM